MSLEDGEYELDISVLLQNTSTIDTPTSTSKDTNENIAIRYGFIPDSMDQSKPLKLYQKDQTCILKASSTEGSNKPIFFEGIPQRYHRNSYNGTPSSTPSNGGNDSFYLTFNKEINGNVVHLKKLESTIRFNKSRNVVKIQKQVNEWEKEYDRKRSASRNTKSKITNNASRSINNDDSKPLHSPNVTSFSRSTPPISSTPITSPLRKPPTTSKKASNKPSSKIPQATKTVSSKRPPALTTSTLDVKPDQNSEPIISESDFEDLEMEDVSNTDSKSHDFPVIEFDFGDDDDDDEPKEEPRLSSSTDAEAKPKSKSTTAKKPTKPKTTKPKKQTKPKKPAEIADKSMELDDEFKDLEDQLQELLEEEEVSHDEESPEITSVKNSPTIEISSTTTTSNKNENIVDSDESDFEDFRFTGIKIDEGNSNNGNTNNGNTKKPAFNLNTTGKPRSLRDLVGGGNTPAFDDGSSSEEE